jgi:hypothetical protein
MSIVKLAWTDDKELNSSYMPGTFNRESIGTSQSPDSPDQNVERENNDINSKNRGLPKGPIFPIKQKIWKRSRY